LPHSGQRVPGALERVTAEVGLPTSVTVDHGAEFSSEALKECAWQRGVKLDFIRPGKPNENARM